MPLDSLLRKVKAEKVSPVSSSISIEDTARTSWIKDVSPVALVSSQIINTPAEKIEMVRQWLFKIEEPEEYHHIVLDKCKNDPEALTYFLKHVNGEF